MPELNKSSKVIEVKDVSFSYGSEEILKDISFDIFRGDYLGIVGPNGSGKTTLLKIMLGLLKPSSGKVEIFGKDALAFKDRGKIGYVPQKVTNFEANFPATVWEVVMMGRYSRRGLFNRTTKEDNDIVKKALNQVGMGEYESRLIGDLSGGQQQRVFIARALATEPEIIFLDEPTTGVDQRAQNEFYSLLKKLNKEMNLTLVLISHDIEMISREASCVACINKNLVCYGLPEEFLKGNKVSDIFGEGTKIIAHKHDH